MFRSSPRNRRRHLAVAAVCAALLGGVAFPLAQAADDLKDKKSQVDKQLKGATKSLEHSSQELQAAQAALARSQRDLAVAQSALAKTQAELSAAKILDAQMQQRLEAAVRRLATAKQELNAGRRNIEEQNLEIRRMVVANYQNGGTDLMGLTTMLTSQDPTELTGQLNSVQTVLDKETAILDSLEATRVLLTVREREVKVAKLDVEAKRQEAAENLQRMEALELQARETTAQVAELVALRSDAENAAEAARRADLAEIKKLEAEQARIEQLIREQTTQGTGYNGPQTGNGWLDWPVPGRVTSPYGYRTHPIFGYRALHDGIDIASNCGTPIKASQSGKVLSTYYQTAWGNRVIMGHGVKYGVGVATVYNHLSGFAVSPGQRVSRGQVIGYIGTTGWSTGCHLHYTVMENGRPVDPLKWL